MSRNYVRRPDGSLTPAQPVVGWFHVHWWRRRFAPGRGYYSECRCGSTKA